MADPYSRSSDDFTDVEQISDMIATHGKSEEPNETLEKLTSGIPFSSPDEDKGIEPVQTAQEFIRNTVNAIDNDGAPFTVYVVWFAYILGGWKAVGSTSKSDGRYFEVTYNKDADEFYVDTYIKILNTKFSNTSEEDNA